MGELQRARGRRRGPDALLALVAVGASVSCGSVPDPLAPPPTEALAVLFVGNSLTYSNDMPGMVRELLEEAGSQPIVASSSFPNYGLVDHWIDPRTHDAIALGGWDYVVLQQGPSATEGRPSLLEYSVRFNVEIEAIGALPALYMVWPARSREFDFDGVSESYAMAADSVGGVLFPAGESWRAVWRRDPSASLYGPDGFHPSVLGSYVAALTIAERLLGPSLNPSHQLDTGLVDVSLDAEYGALLMAAVREANTRFPGARQTQINRDAQNQINRDAGSRLENR